MQPRHSDKQKKALSYVPLLAGWIRSTTPLTEKRIATFKTHYPNLCLMLKGTTCDELRRHLAPFITHPVYGGYVETIISPEGEKWLSYTIEKVNTI